MEKIGSLKERRAKEIVTDIVASSLCEAEANLKLLASNGYNDENTLSRIKRIVEEERNPKCQYLEDYFRTQSTFAYINSLFERRPQLLNNLYRDIPDRLDRKSEQVILLSSR